MSDERDCGSDVEGAGDHQGDVDIWYADGDADSIMWGGEHRIDRFADDQQSLEAGDGGSSTSTFCDDKVSFYIGSNEEDDSGEWTTVCRRRSWGNMQVPDTGGSGSVEASGSAASGRGASER